MCNLIAGRCIEPFTSSADCQPNGPKFVKKNGKRLIAEAVRAEALLPLSRTQRIEALGMNDNSDLHPLVVLQPLTQEHSVSENIDEANNHHMSNVVNDIQTKTVAPASTESMKMVQAKKKAPKHALGEQKNEIKRQMKKTAGISFAKQNDFDKNGSIDVADGNLPDVEPESDSGMKKVAITNTESKKKIKSPTKAHGEQKKEMKRKFKNTEKGKPVGTSNCFEENGSVIADRSSNKQENMQLDKPQMPDGSVNGFLADPEEPTTIELKNVTEVKSSSDKKTGNGRLGKKGGGRLNRSEIGLAKAKNPKTSESATEKKESADESVKKDDGTKSMENPQGAAGSSTFPASLMKAKNRKRKGDEDDNAEHGSQPAKTSPVISLAFRQTPDPAISQKMQQSCSGESQMDGNSSMNLTTDGTGTSVVPQQVMGNAQISGGIGQRGRSVSRRLYSNVGNRIVSAADFHPLVPDGNVRGRGRGRRGFGVVGLTGAGVCQGRGAGVGAGPDDARGSGASARGVQQRGMPIRGRGQVPVAAGPPLCYPQQMAMRNTSGLNDSQMNAYSVDHLHLPMIDASLSTRVVNVKPDVTLSSVAMPTAAGECCFFVDCQLAFIYKYIYVLSHYLCHRLADVIF